MYIPSLYVEIYERKHFIIINTVRYLITINLTTIARLACEGEY